MSRWLGMSAAALGRGIANGQIDPVELTDVFLAAIDAHPFRDRIFSCVTPDRARAEAAAASERAKLGLRKSPLDGVPVSWKDLFDSAGALTEGGTNLLKDRVPYHDCEVLENATALGLVCLGKTHMSELAFSGLGYNPMKETPPCVNDHAAVSGGSSSGAAGSVAFGLAPLAIGSDTGGSVRIPAAWNDLVGLKTTSGRVSLKGVLPLCARFDTVGPLCRTVEDAALSLAALEGHDPVDLQNTTLDGRRFLICDTVAFDDIRDAPRAAFASAVDRLRNMAAVVETAKLPMVSEAIDLSGVLYAPEAYGTWKHLIDANPELMYDEILARFRGGANVSAPDFVAAWQRLDYLRGDYFKATAGYDGVLIPTSPILPPNLERLANDHDYYVAENLLALRNTRIGNMMGVCALTLPTGVPSCGISVMCPPMCEDQLLRIGAAMENALA